MGSKLDLKNSTVRLDEFNRRIDNSFKYFAEQETPVDTDTVRELFRLYDKLYLDVVHVKHITFVNWLLHDSWYIYSSI